MEWSGICQQWGKPSFSAKYQNLQVAKKLTNSCLWSHMFPCIALISPCPEILGGFSVVKLHSFLEIEHLVLIIIIVFACASFNICMLIFSGAGSIYSQSKRWLIIAKKECCYQTALSIERREIKSMMALRIWFRNNYLDNLTSLVIQDFCMGQTISLLLLS